MNNTGTGSSKGKECLTPLIIKDQWKEMNQPLRKEKCKLPRV